MRIDEAIKILEVDIDGGYYGDNSPQEEAAKLGIEALKEIKRVHQGEAWHDGELLPGETREKDHATATRP